MSLDAQTADSSLRLQAAFAELSRDAVPRQDCPAAERLWSAARGFPDGDRAAAGDVRELVEHVATCGVCAEAWRLARELDPAVGVREPRSAPRRWWQQPAWAAVAAAAALALVVSLTWRPTMAPPAGVRGAAEEQLQRTPENGGTLSRREPVLSWPATEGATYDLRVSYDDLEPLWGADNLTSAEATIPDEVLSGLPPGTELLWLVKVRAPDGTFNLKTCRMFLD